MKERSLVAGTMTLLGHGHNASPKQRPGQPTKSLLYAQGQHVATSEDGHTQGHTLTHTHTLKE